MAEELRSSLVPETIAGLLGEIARIATDYELREAVDAGAETPLDGLIWRDCIEEAERLARLGK